MIKTVHIYMKHDDRCVIELLDENEQDVEEMSSEYMPHVGIFGGDDTDISIDNETGKIIGWIPLRTLKTGDGDDQ